MHSERKGQLYRQQNSIVQDRKSIVKRIIENIIERIVENIIERIVENIIENIAEIFLLQNIGQQCIS